MGAIGDGYHTTLAMLTDRFGWAFFFDEAQLDAGVSGVVLIDELENHLHPKLQRAMIEQLHRQFPHVQFIATTHSPICAGGLADLGKGEGALYHLEHKKDETEGAIKIEAMLGARYDQILTSPAFGLSSPLDRKTEELVKRLRKLVEEHGDEVENNEKFQNTLTELESRAISVATDEQDRRERLKMARELNEVKTMPEEYGNDLDRETDGGS